MNYALHYDHLIARARGRIVTGYYERHHVLPRCLGGIDEPSNLVDLTPEEHFVAHQLLVKIHPAASSLVVAAMLMAGRIGRNKEYGWLRRAMAEAKRGKPGHPCSPETSAKLSAIKRAYYEQRTQQ